jgi:putative DNA primase/helicase
VHQDLADSPATDTDSAVGRCAEITKQRDLGSKGERIGFRLETVILGLTKWKAVATSCVVVPADAPAKPTGKRISEVGGAILEVLRTRGAGMKKREIVKHFEEQYDSSAIYHEMKKLLAAGQLHVAAGIVALVKS